jgi:ADP-ribose pyrophosphatase YjhB (NUDIX family)
VIKSQKSQIFMHLVFWLSWPVSFVRLWSSERSRVLVVANGYVLLIHTWYAPSRWSLPGGGIRKNENHAVAAARELYEETSVVLEPEDFVSIGKGVISDRGLKFRCHFFVAEVTGQLSVQPHPPEVMEVEWVRISEIDQGGCVVGEEVTLAVSNWRNLVK